MREKGSVGFSLKVTGKGVGGTRVAKCNVNLMKKWSRYVVVVPECYLQYNRVCKLNQVGCLICEC